MNISKLIKRSTMSKSFIRYSLLRIKENHYLSILGFSLGNFFATVELERQCWDCCCICLACLDKRRRTHYSSSPILLFYCILIMMKSVKRFYRIEEFTYVTEIRRFHLSSAVSDGVQPMSALVLLLLIQMSFNSSSVPFDCCIYWLFMKHHISITGLPVFVWNQS